MSQKIDSKSLDVIVIGAGPAGGSAARELAKRGKKVLLIERSQEIGEPNYSTAGTPKETIEQFDLPKKIISDSWDKIVWASPRKKAEWKFPDTKGYVLDFAGLRKFLAEDAACNGAEIMVGTSAAELIEGNGRFTGVRYHGVFGNGEAYAKAVIDASGHNEFANSTLKLNTPPREYLAEGLEYQVAGSAEEIKNTLLFYMGKEYAPHGYAWVFPTNQGTAAKIGICRYGRMPNDRPLSESLNQFFLALPYLNKMEPTEVHAGTAYADGGTKKFVMKNLVIIGDAAHQINPLGGEGIRHSLRVGQLAAEIISKSLGPDGCDGDLLKNEYEKRWEHEFSRKWEYSRILSDIIYQKLDADELDTLIEALQELPAEDMFEILFHYRFEIFLKHPILLVKLSKIAKDFTEVFSEKQGF